jgi:DNA-binding response OmpR family regulator
MRAEMNMWDLRARSKNALPLRGKGHVRILVIEDDLRMLDLLRKGLGEAGIAVTIAADGDSGLEIALAREFDAIVLDIGLPGRSGYAIAEWLRHRAHRPAIVMLTALNQEHNIVYGLDAGADDYLTKPFSLRELVARITSAVRRTRIAAADNFCFGPFHFDIPGRRLFCDGAEIHISRTEYLLLRALALHRGEIVPRRQLIQAVWGNEVKSHGALDTLVNSVRDKLDEAPGLISTIRGSGYSLVEEPELSARMAS